MVVDPTDVVDNNQIFQFDGKLVFSSWGKLL
jgi:hypothetical protein